MSDFRRLTSRFWASPQLTEADIADAAREGVTLIVNNRPDGEEPGQPSSSQIGTAAKAAGIAYAFIPFSGANVGEADLDAFDKAVGAADGLVLGFCRSGTRSTVLRSLAEARRGTAPDAIIRDAANGGYDIEGLRPRLDALARNAQ